MAMWPWLLCITTVAAGSEFPEVTTTVGRLRGISEGNVHVFRGIPYALPPQGDLRWRPPVASEPWKGLREATEYGSRCLAVDWQNHSKREGSEDCLYLNVYVPSDANHTSELPCFLWIHGGGYEYGASNEYNASKLVSFLSSQQLPAIVVTLNYRLHVLGFLGSDLLRQRDPLRSTGNYGLQDQRLGMRWVKDNIQAFGGDQARIMLFGQSAGAGSVSSHVAMPRSSDLFSAALMQSGGFAGWSAQHMKLKELWFQRFMKQSGCHDVQCLVDLPAEELLTAYLSLPGRCCSSKFGDPTLAFAPTIDGVELTAHPLDLLKRQKVQRVPMVIGTTLDGGARFTFKDYQLSTPEFLKLFEDKFQASRAQAELYRSESHVTVSGYAEGWWSAERVVTDQMFYCPSHLARRLLARPQGTQGVCEDPLVFGYVLEHSSSGPIVTHNTDLPFVFMDLPEHASLEEHDLASDMAKAWYRFAAFGQPGALESGANWAPQTESAAPVMKFQVRSKGGSAVIDGNDRDAQCSFMLDWINRTSQDLPDPGRDRYRPILFE